ncbi:hypothetical protein FSP39_017428 [Pinctada imbricata]|uniref:Uncharacterized protein n=1 Tax=Pinctada imbricata TaxID=66713 RepID=A0AA89BYW8_PINIB|nr:hypothetical protein FSP39_017428 [Pinctada imbricata]
MSVPVLSNAYSVGDVCLPVTLDISQDTFTIDSAWIAGAFFLGIFLGALIAGICAPFCIRDLEKKRRQDEEEAMRVEYETNTTVVTTRETNMLIATNDWKDTKGGKGGKKGKAKGKKQTSSNIDESDNDPTTLKISGEVRLDLTFLNGFSKIMTKFNSEDAEEEMGKQDMQRVQKMNTQHQDEKDQVFLKMLRNRLKKMKVPPTSLSTVMRNIIDDLNNRRKMYENERNDEEQAIRAQHGKDKGTDAMDDELEKLSAKTNQKLAHLHNEEREAVRKELAKNTNLSEREIDELMERLLGDMSRLEKRHAMELARQRRALEERLAKRKQIIEMRKLQDQQDKEQVTDNADSYEEALKTMVAEKKLTEKQKNQLLNEYLQDLQKLNATRDLESQRHQQDLADKLAKRRLKRIQQLQEKHQRELAGFIEKADRSTDTKDFVQAYTDLKEQQRLELENEEVELDQTELQQLDKLRQDASADKKKEIEERSARMNQDIIKVAGSGSDYDVDKVIKLHKKRMAQLEADRLDERNRMAAKLREKWERKMMQLDEETELNNQEQVTLMEQQNETVKKVLANSIDLNAEAKQRILKEHEHNMQVLSNQLQRSKLQQQKSLEDKLNQRRARLAEQRRQKEQALFSKAKANREEREKLQEQLDIELQREEKRLEEERKTAIAAFRQRIAEETEEALRMQEQELGLLIGRLEVGAARRAAIIQRQDQELQTLQNKLENKMEREGSRLSGVDQIIQIHHNQVENLNERLQNTREHQERLIQEKVQAKMLQKESELNEKIAEEKHDNKNSSLRRRGAGKASDILGGIFMEQRHKRQREELEYEMKLELEKSKEELNQQLELELSSELQEQKKQFLNQLASASSLSREELEETVESAVRGRGTNKKTAKKLAKDIREGVERSKTSYGMDEEDQDYYDHMQSRRGSRPMTSVGRPASGALTHSMGRPSSASLGMEKKGKKKKGGRSSIAPEPMESWKADYDSDELL